MAKIYDTAIIGATPSGFAAACKLAKKGLSVVVINAPSSHNLSCPLSLWVSAEIFDLKLLPKSLIKSAHASAFDKVNYLNAEMDKKVTHEEGSTLGYFIPTKLLTKQLHDQATKQKVTIKNCTTHPAISLKEDHVEIFASKPIKARFLMVAQNHPTDVLNELGQPARGAIPQALNIVGLDIPLTEEPEGKIPAWAKKISKALNIVQMPQRTELGMFFICDKKLHVRIISSAAMQGAKTAELSNMLAKLQKNGTLGEGLILKKAAGAVWRPLAGGALEQEVHEAKRTLLIGSAGGFAQSVTGHDLLPSMKSAVIASDIIIKALTSKTPQDTLSEFTPSWRAELADYLRPPNTSLPMLVPLLFVNEKIVSKFTGAVIKGENI